MRAFETRKGNVNVAGPILKVISHSPSLLIIEPSAAFMIMLLGFSSVLSLSGMEEYLFFGNYTFPCPCVPLSFVAFIPNFDCNTTLSVVTDLDNFNFFFFYI